MEKPRIFVGSSSEGLGLAKSLAEHLLNECDVTIWSDNLFLPSRHPLDVLEDQLRNQQFAVLVASPDDQIVKRQETSPAMRDNILEFGLFVGALGRNRAFFVVPSAPRIELPSDLVGIVNANYSVEFAADGPTDIADAMLAPACQIVKVVRFECAKLQQQRDAHTEVLRHTDKYAALERLYVVTTRLRDALMTVQRDALMAFIDNSQFERAKAAAQSEIERLIRTFQSDASDVGLEGPLEFLLRAALDALTALPFPSELNLSASYGQSSALKIGSKALSSLLTGGDPTELLRKAAVEEATARFESLQRKYQEWWDVHSRALQEATKALQDGIFRALLQLNVGSTLLRHGAASPKHV